MKYKQPQWCKAYLGLVRDPRLSVGARLTLILLRSYCGLSKDKCWPSTRLLCADLKCNRKTLFRWLDELEQYNCIRRKQHSLKNNLFSTTHYTLLDERKAITKAAFPSPKKGDTDRLEEESECKYTTAKKIRAKIISLPSAQNGDTSQKDIDVNEIG